MARLQHLITELRRRKVFRSAGIYIVAAWVAVQVASLVFPAVSVPDTALLYVWLATLFVFPLAMVFAWFYDSKKIVGKRSCRKKIVPVFTYLSNWLESLLVPSTTLQLGYVITIVIVVRNHAQKTSAKCSRWLVSCRFAGQQSPGDILKLIR